MEVCVGVIGTGKGDGMSNVGKYKIILGIAYIICYFHLIGSTI